MKFLHICCGSEPSGSMQGKHNQQCIYGFGYALQKPQFKRTRSVVEREEVYTKVQRYKRKLKPEYDGRVCLETVQCIFSLPEKETDRYRMIYEGQETYGFIMSNKYILGLFAYCEAARKTIVWDGVEFEHLTEQEQKIVLLDNVRDVLFQALSFR